MSLIYNWVIYNYDRKFQQSEIRIFVSEYDLEVVGSDLMLKYM
jgi:hypothetical protein